MQVGNEVAAAVVGVVDSRLQYEFGDETCEQGAREEDTPSKQSVTEQPKDAPHHDAQHSHRYVSSVVILHYPARDIYYHWQVKHSNRQNEED